MKGLVNLSQQHGMIQKIKMACQKVQMPHVVTKAVDNTEKVFTHTHYKYYQV